jgi:hypothetical protein
MAVLCLANILPAHELLQSVVDIAHSLYPFLPDLELEYDQWVVATLLCNALVAGCVGLGVVSAYLVGYRNFSREGLLYMFSITSVFARTVLVLPYMHLILYGLVVSWEDSLEKTPGALVAFPGITITSFPHAIFAGISIIVAFSYFAYLLALSAISFDSGLKSPRLLAAPFGRTQAFFLFIEIALVAFAHVHNIFWANAGVFGCTLLLTTSCIICLPFYRQWINDLFAFQFGFLIPLPFANYAYALALEYSIETVTQSTLRITVISAAIICGLGTGLGALAISELRFRLMCWESCLAPRASLNEYLASIDSAQDISFAKSGIQTSLEILFGPAKFPSWRAKLARIASTAFQRYIFPFEAEICSRCSRYRICKPFDAALHSELYFSNFQ